MMAANLKNAKELAVNKENKPDDNQEEDSKPLTLTQYQRKTKNPRNLKKRKRRKKIKRKRRKKIKNQLKVQVQTRKKKITLVQHFRLDLIPTMLVPLSHQVFSQRNSKNQNNKNQLAHHFPQDSNLKPMKTLLVQHF